MWTPTTRQQHSHTVTRYQTDLTDVVARDRAALAEALCDGPAARVADARDRQRDIRRDAGGLRLAAGAKRLTAVGTLYRWFAPAAMTGALINQVW